MRRLRYLRILVGGAALMALSSPAAAQCWFCRPGYGCGHGGSGGYESCIYFGTCMVAGQCYVGLRPIAAEIAVDGSIVTDARWTPSTHSVSIRRFRSCSGYIIEMKLGTGSESKLRKEVEQLTL